MSSKAFNVWSKAVSGRLESRVRISNTITYNNFPFPNLNAKSQSALEDAALGVLEARKQFPNSSLADLYGASSMPISLMKAHKSLDEKVNSVLGLTKDVSEEELLSKLFSDYESLSRGQTLVD